ncbi:acyltransferase [Butyrivibrio sp. XPD2002]|uniref:acyltransferase n=1 Tax=Butyrivibrio sp. XPD2002 TaxID=1280665 RepID=UPI00041B4D90|nr:hypothetical protein [Butyrivibrio sp. XPD2002]
MNNITEIDEKGNKIVGYFPGVYQSAIVWGGSNNVLYCEKGVNLKNSKLTFNGDNSLIYLHSNMPTFNSLDLSIFSDSVIHIGNRCGAMQTVKAIIGEKKHLFIGNDCLFSYGITIRNADGHLIYSTNDYNRTNRAKSIFIGDHVWVGQDALILKGTYIDSGSIIGGRSVISNKRIEHNSLWAGSPGRLLKKDVFWEMPMPNNYSEEMLASADDYVDFLSSQNRDYEEKDNWIYKFAEEQEISWNEIELNFSKGTALEKCNYLIKLNERCSKNRFVHGIT